MEKVRYEQEKVRTFLEKIRTTNQKLESSITLCRSNHNGNYFSAKRYLVTQNKSILPEQQPSQQTNRDRNKRNVSYVKEEKFVKTKSCNGVDISDATWFFLSE